MLLNKTKLKIHYNIKLALRYLGNSEIDNNIIYTLILIHNKQTIKILRVFHPHAPVRFPSPFSVQFIIFRNFVFPSYVF